MIRFLATHPGTMIIGLLFAASALAAHPLPVLSIAALAGGCWWASTHHDKRHVAKQQALWRADYENWLATHGHPAGTYGQYPPERTP